MLCVTCYIVYPVPYASKELTNVSTCHKVSERFCRDALKVHGERQLLKQEGRVMSGPHFLGNSAGGGAVSAKICEAWGVWGFKEASPLERFSALRGFFRRGT